MVLDSAVSFPISFSDDTQIFANIFGESVHWFLSLGSSLQLLWASIPQPKWFLSNRQCYSECNLINLAWNCVPSECFYQLYKYKNVQNW